MLHFYYPAFFFILCCLYFLVEEPCVWHFEALWFCVLPFKYIFVYIVQILYCPVCELE